MSAYYSENDAKAAAWLRELIRRDLIAPGDVDERSIVDVRPNDLRAYTQCHFFAGIGVWSYALRRAGWADDRRVWTGSCPCQPFSDAGAGEGFDDPRHLWPHFFRLIAGVEQPPDVVFGEQVASKAGFAWLDLVSADLEGAGYAVGAADLCAAGVGAPHIRQRLWWVAESKGQRCPEGRVGGSIPLGAQWTERSTQQPERRRSPGRLGYAGYARLEGQPGDVNGCDESGRIAADETRPVAAAGTARRLGDPGRDGDRQHARELRGDEGQHEVGPALGDHAPFAAGAAGGLANADGAEQGRREFGLHAADGSLDGSATVEEQSHVAGPVNGFWADADWIPCTDGKARPVEPGTFPLAHGAPARVGRLRGYGNAIVSEVAVEFIEAYLDVVGG